MSFSEDSDIELGRRLLAFWADHDMTLEQGAALIKRRRQWASKLRRGKIKRFQFATRNRIIKILGGYHDASNAARDGGATQGRP